MKSIAFAVFLVLFVPADAHAQEGGEVVAGLGVGTTYYCLISRCNTGTELLGLVAYGPLPHVRVIVGGRWHTCFDCDRFLIAETGLQLYREGRTVEPFLVLGVDVSSDPDFIGSRVGAHGAAGAWFWLSDRWGLQLEAQGRKVGRAGRGGWMGEFSLGVLRRLSE